MNTVFMPPGSVVVEIFPNHVKHVLYERIAHYVGVYHFKVRVREVEKSDIKQILGLITDYNRAAKRADAAPLPEQGNMIDIGEVYRAMNVDILRVARTQNKSDLARFQRAVQHKSLGLLVFSPDLDDLHRLR